MDDFQIYKSLDIFYDIRGDNLGRDYINEFLRVTSSENVKQEKYGEWLELHGHKLGRKYRPDTRKNYRGVLRQFIRFINATNNLEKVKKQQKKNKDVVKKPRTKIHNTYYDMQNG